MPLKDLFKNMCNNSNPINDFASHFTRDHAFKNEDLKNMVCSEQNFMEASIEELVEEFYNITHTFKSDEMLTEMRNNEESNNYEGAQSLGFFENFENQNELFHSSDDEILVYDDECIFDYNLKSVKEVQQPSQDQEIKVSGFPLNIKKTGEKKEHKEKYFVNKNFDMPMNNFPSDASQNQFLFNPNFHWNMFGRLNNPWNSNFASYSTMPSYEHMPRLMNPTSIVHQHFSVRQLVPKEHKEKYFVNKNFDMPMNNFPSDASQNQFLFNPNFHWNMFGRLNNPWNSNFESYSTMPAYEHMPRLMNPTSIVHQHFSVKQLPVVVPVNEENKSNTEIGNEQAVFQTSRAKFKEMKNSSKTNKDYSLTPDNEKQLVESALAEGKRLLENNELPSAVLCFKLAVKQDPMNAEAWQLLGTTQAENEQDQLAISALKKCVELQPENLTAIFNLAVSYLNENDKLQACYTLMEWLDKNAKYSDIVKSITVSKKTHEKEHMLTKELYESAKEVYMEAIYRSVKSGFSDADLQNAFGILLSLKNENSKALDCFNVALQIRPLDARLWNRVGVTLANIEKCKEAITAYRHALDLCPGFIRARYNLAITCIQLDSYREAIKHLIKTLNQQASVVSINSESRPVLSDGIWSALRTAVTLADLPELLNIIDNKDLDLLNEKFKKCSL